MVKFSDLEDAFLFVNSDSYGMNTALLNRDSGRLYFRSDGGDLDEIGAADVDWERCIEIPHRNDLDLGQSLVFEFVDECLADEYNQIRQVFRKRAAYRRFKNILGARGLLQTWYDFENLRVEQALRLWCQENEIELSN